MPFMQSKIFIPLPPEIVYHTSKNIAALKPYLKDIQEITALEHSSTRSRHRFVGTAAGRRLSWDEVDEWDDPSLGNKFHSPVGDFDKFQGRYTYTAVPGGTEFAIDLEYELNIPLIGGLLKNLIHKLVQENCDNLVKAMREMCLSDQKSS